MCLKTGFASTYERDKSRGPLIFCPEKRDFPNGI